MCQKYCHPFYHCEIFEIRLYSRQEIVNRSVKMDATWVELSKSAYEHNIAFLSHLTGIEKLALVVKANGYGHGLREMVNFAIQSGVQTLCVHSVSEAEQVRSTGFLGRVIIIGPVMATEGDALISCDAEPVCYTVNSLSLFNKAASKAGVVLPVHLKLETGTNRQGIRGDELSHFLATLQQAKHLSLKAVYSHFANIEDTTDPRFARQQLATFETLIEEVKSYGFEGFERHFASSAATILYGETHFDMVRVGIAQYGLWPSKETYLSFVTEHGQAEYLHPVLSWKTRIAQVKSLSAGEHIGYGCTSTVTRNSKIAVLPIGYSDGYSRLLSNSSRVLIGGRFAPVAGRIAMNLMMVDVTDIPDAHEGDEVVLIGKSGEQVISAEELAVHAQSINYEVVCSIAPHIPRIVVD